MADHDRADDDLTPALADLSRKLDTVAGAVAHIAAGHTDVLAKLTDVEGRRSQDALEVAQRLGAMERQVLGGTEPAPPAGPGGEGLAERIDALERQVAAQRDDLALALEVLAGLAQAVERLDSRTDDRLAAVRDAAASPVADLQALLSARNDLVETSLAEIQSRLDALPVATDPAPTSTGPDLGPVEERVEELAQAVQALSWQVPEVSDQVTSHVEGALAGMLRLVDVRLDTLRGSLAESRGGAPSGGMGGFEAGAVMGAAQAAWNRLEQRLDAEFDDLGRQLQSMASLIEQAVSSAEAAANRPVVSGDQIRRAASAVKETVVGAGRSRRERRGGPRSLGAGDSDAHS